MNLRAPWTSALLLLLALGPIGCKTPVDTEYGRARRQSINGVGAFAEILRQQGHEVRGAIRLTETLSNWANVLVRVPQRTGRPSLEEGKWMLDWLREAPDRKVVYLTRDFDTGPEFWKDMLSVEPANAEPAHVRQVQRNLDKSKTWAADLPKEPKEVANDADWFAFQPKPPTPSICKTLGGPWAEGIDANAAAISKHLVFKDSEFEPVLLSGDGAPLVISWTLANDSQVLAIANGSFLLNAALLNKARRPLTMKVVDWIGPDSSHVAIVEGYDPASDEDSDSMSFFHLLTIEPFGWVATQFMIFLSLIAMATAIVLGRPRSDPPSGVERPSAHPEALGLLLAKTGRPDAARAMLETYRRWRHPSHGSGRSAPPPPPSS